MIWFEVDGSSMCNAGYHEARHETFGWRQSCAACITYAWRVGGLNAQKKNFHTQSLSFN